MMIGFSDYDELYLGYLTALDEFSSLCKMKNENVRENFSDIFSHMIKQKIQISLVIPKLPEN